MFELTGLADAPSRGGQVGHCVVEAMLGVKGLGLRVAGLLCGHEDEGSDTGPVVLA